MELLKPAVGMRSLTLTLLVVLHLGITACAASRTWQYPPDPPGSLLELKASKALSARVAVLPLRDLRGGKVERRGWLAAIPFVPFGVSAFDRPEAVESPAGAGATLIKMDPARDFSGAIAEELKSAGVFSSVAFVEKTAPAETDLTVSGTLRATGWKRATTTYLLGPVGPILWILGAPIGNATSTVAMDLQLTPSNDPSRILWQFSMQFEDRRLIGIYYGMEESVENYSVALQEALRPAVANLIQVAEKHPAIFSPIK
jgi:hypothetical protein